MTISTNGINVSTFNLYLSPLCSALTESVDHSSLL